MEMRNRKCNGIQVAVNIDNNCRKKGISCREEGGGRGLEEGNKQE